MRTITFLDTESFSINVLPEIQKFVGDGPLSLEVVGDEGEDSICLRWSDGESKFYLTVDRERLLRAILATEQVATFNIGAVR